MSYIVTVPGMSDRHFEKRANVNEFYFSLDEDQRRLFRVLTSKQLAIVGSEPEVRRMAVELGYATNPFDGHPRTSYDPVTGRPHHVDRPRPVGRPSPYAVDPEEVQQFAKDKGVSLSWARELLRRAVKQARGLRAATRAVGRPRKTPVETQPVIVVEHGHTWDCTCGCHA